MRMQTTETSKAAKIVLVAGIVIIMAVAAIYLFWNDAPSNPDPQALGPAPAATGETPPTPAFTETSASAPIAARGDYLNSPADLRQLTEQQSKLELKKLEVAVAEQEARLKELGASQNSSALPQIVAMPGAAAPPELASSAAMERVISVQGLGGRIMATVETPEGLRTIMVGDSLGYGQVERISISGVEVREGEETRLISVEE